MRRAFQDVHDGFSTDEVVVRDQLNAAFIAKCRETLPDADEPQLNWAPLTFARPATWAWRRQNGYRSATMTTGTPPRLPARLMYDRHGVSIDRVLCDPQLRQGFDVAAR